MKSTAFKKSVLAIATFTKSYSSRVGTQTSLDDSLCCVLSQIHFYSVKSVEITFLVLLSSCGNCFRFSSDEVSVWLLLLLINIIEIMKVFSKPSKLVSSTPCIPLSLKYLSCLKMLWTKTIKLGGRKEPMRRAQCNSMTIMRTVRSRGQKNSNCLGIVIRLLSLLSFICLLIKNKWPDFQKSVLISQAALGVSTLEN